MTPDEPLVTIALAGDVMTGRGIDQIQPFSCRRELREPSVRDARQYVALAEQRNGPVPAPVPADYVWGEALETLERVRPAAWVVNLETSITVSDDFSPEKVVHYRMHPQNVSCLKAARVDVCVLANNHVLDFGRDGLRETLETLDLAGVPSAGAGRDLGEASRPARVPLGSRGRLLVFGVGSTSSGIPESWAATPERPGVRLLEDLSGATADDVAREVRSQKAPGDLAVVSIHWGSNWGFEIPREHRSFARRLVEGGVDVVHGHSSHHARPIEVYQGKLILYGCGDLVSDYEGISGHEEWRPGLGLLYFVTVSARDGRLEDLRLAPLQMQRLRLARPSPPEVAWLEETLNRISRWPGLRLRQEDDWLALREVSPAAKANQGDDHGNF